MSFDLIATALILVAVGLLLSVPETWWPKTLPRQPDRDWF